MPNVTMKRRVRVKRYEVEAITYRDAIVAAGATLSDASLDAVNAFVVTCKEKALWAKLLDVGVFAGSNLTAALVKLKHSGQATLTNNNFIAGDYAETGANGGLLGNGTTKFLGTGFNASTQLPDNAHLSFYMREDVVTTGNRIALGSLLANEQYFVGSLVPASDTTGRLGQLAVGAQQAAPFTKGFLAVTRPSATSIRLSRNAAVVATNQGTVAHVKPNQQFYVWASHAIGIANAFLPVRGSFYSIGEALSDAEVLALYGAVQKLQLDLGRAV